MAGIAAGLTGAAGTATVGGVIDDEVDLTGGFSPTGEVTFSVYAPGDTTCTTVLASSTRVQTDKSLGIAPLRE